MLFHVHCIATVCSNILKPKFFQELQQKVLFLSIAMDKKML